MSKCSNDESAMELLHRQTNASKKKAFKNAIKKLINRRKFSLPPQSPIPHPLHPHSAGIFFLAPTINSPRSNNRGKRKRTRVMHGENRLFLTNSLSLSQAPLHFPNRAIGFFFKPPILSTHRHPSSSSYSSSKAQNPNCMTLFCLKNPTYTHCFII